MEKVFAVLFCLIGLAALLGAWNAFLDKQRRVMESATVKNKAARKWVGLLLDAALGQFGEDTDSIGWVTAVIALSAIGFLFLGGGLYVGLT